jgi:hypothetical protein
MVDLIAQELGPLSLEVTWSSSVAHHTLTLATKAANCAMKVKSMVQSFQGMGLSRQLHTLNSACSALGKHQDQLFTELKNLNSLVSDIISSKSCMGSPDRSMTGLSPEFRALCDLVTEQIRSAYTPNAGMGPIKVGN